MSPAPFPATPLTATINFTLPDDRLPPGLDPVLFPFDQSKQRPFEAVELPIFNLRPELEGLPVPAPVQLDERGFAVLRHESCTIGGLVKHVLNASEVLVWNSVMRKADLPVPSSSVEGVQQAPLEGRVPATNVQPSAGFAHVDQDPSNGRRICESAGGADVFERNARVQTINLWRPLAGPVRNSPLAAVDFRSLRPEDASIQKSPHGTAYDLHYSDRQKFCYLQHQMPDELFLLRCYDSLQGADGRALYGGHVAATVRGEKQLGGKEVPRTSVEVRLVVLH